MEKKTSKEITNLKLSFIDIFPSYEEIDENNEGIIISFQNVDLTYNLTELIKNREELFVPQQTPNQTIKINLIKSNNPYATGPFTVKNGEQWVTFTYDHKKKQSSNLALSLIDCIKIKFFCKMDYVQGLNNTLLTNTEIQTTKNDSILANILQKPSPKKLYNNFTTKKKNNSHNNNIGNMMEHDSLRTEESKISKMLENISPEVKSNNNTNNNLNNTTLNSSKNTNINNPLLKSENLSEFNPLASSSGVMGKDFKVNEKNKSKNVKKTYSNNLNNNNNNINNNSVNIENKKSSDITSPSTQKKKNSNKNNETLNREKTKNNNSLSNNNISNTIDGKNPENNKSKQNLKRNKSKNLMENNNNNNSNNKTKTSKKEKQTKSVTPNANNLNNANNEQKSKKITKDLSNKNVYVNQKKEDKNEKNEEDINNNTNNNNNNISENIYENKIDNDKNINSNININNNELIDNNNINNNENDINLANKLINDNYENIEKNNEPLLDDDNDELENYGLDNFSKKLEDFQLLYSDEYIKGIKEEDYSLEIELYIEKLIELITEYHLQIEEKDLEYQLIKNMYQKNIYQYLEINKLQKKLQLLRDDYELKKNIPKPINEEHDKNYINNLITNKVEMNMFKFLLYSQKEKETKEKREKIKKILKNLLNKPKHKKIINQNEKIAKWVQINIDKQNQGKEKGKKKGKQEKPQQDNKDKGGNKNDKKKKNASNSPSKSKNKFNKSVPEEKDKKSKK